VIGKLRNSQNEKLGCDCERKSEKIKAKPTPPPPPLATPMRVVESESHSVRTSSVPSVKRTLR